MSEKTALSLQDLQDRLWDFASHRVITVASRAGILRRLSVEGATVEQVAADLGLEPGATGKMVRALTAMGLLEAEHETYWVVPQLAHCFRPGPTDYGPFLEHSHMMYERWGENLEGWLRGEQWATKRRGPPDARRFGAAMQAIGTQTAMALDQGLDLSEVRSLLDVGGGFGHYARVLCEAHPGLSATVVDLPEVVQLGHEAAVEHGLDQRVTFIGGDYHEVDLQGPYELVLIANVLHLESEARAAALIQRGADVVADGGRLAVLDFCIDDRQRRNLLGALFAINMRSFGDTYPEPTIRQMMHQAGLSTVERVDLNRQRWVILGSR